MSRVALAKHSREEKHKQEQETGSSAEYLAGEKKWTQNVGMLAAIAVPMAVSAIFTGGASLPLWAGMLSAGTGYLAGAKIGEEAAEWIEEGEFTWGEDRHSKGENVSRGKFYKEEAQTARNTLRGVAEQTDTAMLTGAATSAAMYGFKEIAAPVVEGLKVAGSEKLLGRVGAMERLSLDPSKVADVAKYNAMKKQASGGAIWDALTKKTDQMPGRISGKIGKDMATMYKENPESAIFKTMAEDKPELFEAFTSSIGKKGEYKGGLKYEDFFNTEELVKEFEGASRGELHKGVMSEYLGVDVDTGKLDKSIWNDKSGYSAEFSEAFQETSGKKFKGMDWTQPDPVGEFSRTDPSTYAKPTAKQIEAQKANEAATKAAEPIVQPDPVEETINAPKFGSEDTGETPLVSGTEPAIVPSSELTQTEAKDPFFQYMAGPKKGQAIEWYPGKNIGNLLGAAGNLLGLGADAVQNVSGKVGGAYETGKKTVNMLQQMKSGDFNPMDFMGKY